MIYTINSATIYNLANEEISRAAAAAYSEDGVSLYDSVVLHSNDADEVARLQGDAVNTIVKRTWDVVTILTSDSSGNPRLQFDVPDMDSSLEAAVTAELTRFIVLNIAAAWFQSRAKDRVEEFANRAQVALDKVSHYLHTRKTPTRS